MTNIFDLSEVAKRIDFELDNWPGNCYGISCNIVEENLVEGRAVYGHYYGPVTKKNKHFNHTRPFQRHGWILRDTEVLDFTRWCFEEKEPYLYVTTVNDEYDEGGNKIKRIYRRPPPSFSSEEKQAELGLSENTKQFVLDDLLGGSPELTLQQAIWIANLDPQNLGNHAYEIYNGLKDSNLKAAVPIDNWMAVMEHR
jgi:hypothetical protein